MEFNEHGKIRQASFDNDYEYTETKTNGTGEVTEYFSMCYSSDYSFMYANLDRETNVGKMVVETDSAFYQAFKTLLEGIDKLHIDCDFSERYLEFEINNNDEVEISFHLLPEETDGTVDVKNVMYDLRSKADQDNTDIKKRLKNFFNVIENIIQSDTLEDTKKLFFKH